jgi:hypothetical protein
MSSLSVETRTVHITCLGQRKLKLNENMMLANIVSLMTQICKFCHLYWLNEVLFFVTKLVSNEPTKTDYISSRNPKRLTQMSYKYSENRFPTMNPFCLLIIMSARLTSYIESIRMLKMELNVCDCENINGANWNWPDNAIAKSNLVFLLQWSGNVGCPLSLL